MLGEVLTAIVTPFDADGAVAIDRFRALCRHLVDNGSDGIVVTGTTGETPTLTDDERMSLYEVALDEVGGHQHRRRRHRHVRHARTRFISPSARTRSAWTAFSS